MLKLALLMAILHCSLCGFMQFNRLPSMPRHAALVPPPNATVTNIFSVRVNGSTYLTVRDLKLGCMEAEAFCRKEFHVPMHLASIKDQAEWDMIRRYLFQNGQEQTNVWLGGLVNRLSTGEMFLDWSDKNKVEFHLIPQPELLWLNKMMKPGEERCLFGQARNGIWSTRTAIDEQHHDLFSFVCKSQPEQNQPNASSPLKLVVPPEQPETRLEPESTTQVINQFMIKMMESEPKTAHIRGPEDHETFVFSFENDNDGHSPAASGMATDTFRFEARRIMNLQETNANLKENLQQTPPAKQTQTPINLGVLKTGQASTTNQDIKVKDIIPKNVI